MDIEKIVNKIEPHICNRGRKEDISCCSGTKKRREDIRQALTKVYEQGLDESYKLEKEDRNTIINSTRQSTLEEALEVVGEDKDPKIEGRKFGKRMNPFMIEGYNQAKQEIRKALQGKLKE